MSILTGDDGITTLVFQALDWHIEDNPEEFRYTVKIFGETADNEQVVTIINDFANYVYIQLPLKTVTGKLIKWDSQKCDALVEFIYEDWRVKNEDFPFFRLIWRKPLYFYHETDEPFLMVGCACRNSIYKLGNIFGDIKRTKEVTKDGKGKTKTRTITTTVPKKVYITGVGEAVYDICAGRVDPSIKFITAKESKYSGWYRVRGKLITGKKQKTMCKYEIIASIKNIDTVESNDIAKPKIASFDTEFYSHNHNKMPEIENPIDVCYLIGFSIKRLCAGIETVEKYAVCSKNYNPEKIEDITIIRAEDEKDLYLKFKDLILDLNPDVITGFNIFNFDFERICWRAKNILQIWDEFGQLSKVWNWECQVSGKGWESDAYGAMNFYYPIAPGRVHLDVHTYVSREMKLIKYKLDYVSKKFLNMRKIDISAKEQFKMYESNDPDKMSDLIKYCLQDTILPLLLIEKLNIWVSLVEMSNVANAPILTLQVRGQQIKTFASIYRKADQNSIIITNPPPPAFENFQGATVFDPVPGIYHYIAGHDFASLYPSIMIAYNICYTTLLLDGVHDHIPDSMCNVLEWEDHIGCEHAEKRKTKIDPSRVVCGKKFRYRFVKKDIFEGLVPKILNELLSSRKATRNELKKYTDDTGKPLRDEFKLICNILDKRQNSYKITCNSTYGFLGVGKNGMLPLMEGAAAVTAMGRKLIGISVEYIRHTYPKSKLIYGDSVAGKTPLFLMNIRGEIEIKTIESLGDEWIAYDEFKHEDTNRTEKQQCTTKYKIWTDQGWSTIRRVIRHKTCKDIYRVVTHTGLVDVTEDHSLLDENLHKITPKNCIIGTKLLQSYPDVSHQIGVKKLDDIMKYWDKISFDTDDEKLSFIYGFFYDDMKYKIIPSFVMNGTIDIMTAFFVGYCMVDGCKYYNEDSKTIRFDNMGQIGSAQLYFIAKNLGFNVSMNCHIDKPDIYRLTLSKTQLKCKNAIKKIYKLHSNYTDFVYDLETDIGRFQAGIGDIIVKNTDSCFNDFQSKSAKECFEIGKKISTEVTAKFPPPVKLEFEKVMKILLIFTKKRYAGIICDEEDREKGFIFRGIVMAKRNGAPYLRKLYKIVLDKVLHNAPKDDVIYTICEGLQKMFNQQIPVEKMAMIVKVGKSENDRLAQVHLVNQEHERGIPVQKGERLEYIFVRNENDASTKGHVETLRYFKENSGVKKLDYLFYFEHQFLKPLAEIVKTVYNDHKFMKNLYEIFRKKYEIVQTINRIAKKRKLVLIGEDGKEVGSKRKTFQSIIHRGKIILPEKKTKTRARKFGCVVSSEKDGKMFTEYIEL